MKNNLEFTSRCSLEGNQRNGNVIKHNKFRGYETVRIGSRQT